MTEPLNFHLHELSLYRKCPQKFKFVHDGLRAKGPRVNAKMLYGSLWHAGYVFRRAGLGGACNYVINDQMLTGDGAQLARDLWQEVERDLDWYDQQTHAVKLKRLLWIEEPGKALTLPIDDGLSICGRPDLVAEVEAEWGGGLVIMDHKTHVVLSETASGPRYEPSPRGSTLQRYFHSRQFPTYVGLWNRLHPDEPCETALVNLVPQRVTHVLGFLETRRGKPKLPEVHREVIPYDPSYCERLVMEAVHTAREMRDKLADPDSVWPQHDHSCLDWNEACPFLEVCEAGDSTRELMVKSMQAPTSD